MSPEEKYKSFEQAFKYLDEDESGFVPRLGTARGPDPAGGILLGESSATAAPILETVDFRVENWRSAEVGYSGLDIQVKPALDVAGGGNPLHTESLQHY